MILYLDDEFVRLTLERPAIFAIEEEFYLLKEFEERSIATLYPGKASDLHIL